MVQILKNKKVKVIICLMIILIMLVLTMKQSYAAGDVSNVPYKQIVIAMGEGAKAALSAFDDRIRGIA